MSNEVEKNDEKLMKSLDKKVWSHYGLVLKWALKAFNVAS